MAIAFPNRSLSATFRLPAFQKPSKTIKLKTLPLQGFGHLTFCKSHEGFSSFSFPPIARRSFRCSLHIEDSNPSTIDGEDGQINRNNLEPEEGHKKFPNMKTLIEVYKAAISNGDEKTISDIEAIILIMENEKNELIQKVEALSADIPSEKGKYLHLQADFDNFRKRREKEHLTLTSDARGEVIESLLPLVDNFEGAKQKVKPETEKEKKIDTSYQGIYKQFVETLRSLNVSVVATVGKRFDPLLHEAIAREKSEEFNEGVIIQECRRGFLLRDRLLRPAMVKVSAGPGRRKKSAASTDSTGQPTVTAGLDDGSISNR